METSIIINAKGTIMPFCAILNPNKDFYNKAKYENRIAYRNKEKEKKIPKPYFQADIYLSLEEEKEQGIFKKIEEQVKTRCSLIEQNPLEDYTSYCEVENSILVIYVINKKTSYTIRLETSYIYVKSAYRASKYKDADSKRKTIQGIVLRTRADVELDKNDEIIYEGKDIKDRPLIVYNEMSDIRIGKEVELKFEVRVGGYDFKKRCWFRLGNNRPLYSLGLLEVVCK